MTRDFDITVTYEILEAEAPPPGDSSFGVGVLLAANGYARIGCFAQPGRRVILWDCAGKRGHHVLDAAAVKETSGRLRLSRTGKTVRFLWFSERTGDKFECVHEFDYAEPVTVVRLAADTNQLARNLDVRFVDWQLRGGPVLAPPTSNRTWLWLALFLPLLMCLLMGWSYLRRSRSGGVVECGRHNPAR
jgi:hypothetical protein